MARRNGGWFSAPPLDRPNDTVATLTARTNAAIADEIRQAPEDWFWVHNRWKTPKPNWLLSEYKRGLSLPDDPRDAATFSDSDPGEQLAG